MASDFIDSEWEKMLFAENAREKGTFGFQGCANYGNGCDFAGFYLAHYSKEGLCHECELKQFPQRFHGCYFCRCAISYPFMNVCIHCEKEFRAWAFDLFYNKNKSSQTTELEFKSGPNETNDTTLYGLVKGGITFLTFGRGHQTKEVSMIQHKLPDYKSQWPGFYAGVHEGANKWIKPDPFELKLKINISDINWDTQQQVLERELLKLGISVFRDPQIAQFAKN